MMFQLKVPCSFTIVFFITLLLQCWYCTGQMNNTTTDITTSSKLELILTSTTRLISGKYIVILIPTIEIKDFVALLPSSPPSSSTPSMVVQYIYNFTIPSSTSNDVPPLRGICLSDVSDISLQWLIESEYVVSITPDYEMELDTIQMTPESWGLDRIDDQTLPLNQQYNYIYDGSNVDVYILDTGLYFNHIDFSTITDLPTFNNGNSRNNENHQRIVSCGYDAFASLISNNNRESQQELLCSDTIGHGTHVAGIIGGLQNGVAKHTNLISVKIFDTDYGGQLSTLLAGLDYVLGQKVNEPNRSTIINISISGPRCTLLNAILSRLVNDANIVVIVSAGNDASDSCMKSPASADIPVITVSAIDQYDTIPKYANYGTCTNIFAPGHAITSAWIRDRHDVARLSGTSFAAPHVTGVAAQYLQQYPDWKPIDVWKAIETNAIHNQIHNIPDSTSNLLLYNGNNGR